MKISTEEVHNHIYNPDSLIIDVRPVEAYNGWKLKDEFRGGHITTAKSLPLKWTKYIDWLEIVKSKNILPEKTIILYGYDPEETEHVASYFLRSGHKDLYVYNHFSGEWSGNTELPMSYLKNYRQLVYPGWLSKIISGEKPPGYNGNGHVLCHTHYDNYKDYEEGHIPGAVSLNTLILESPEMWNRRKPEELKKSLENLGVRHDTTVIVYGRFSSPDNNDPFPGKSAGHLAAFRCAMIMLYAGVEDVKILNGGITSWETEGYELTTTEQKPGPVNDFGVKIPSRPEYIIDTPRAKSLLKSDKGELVSVRSWEEFTGEMSGYNYIEKKGRIPGAVFGNCGSDAYHMENYRNLDHTMLEFQEVEEFWSEKGITPDKHLAFYCGTGWRGSEAFMNAYLMGWPKISVYDGGWMEWSRDPDNPIETGVPEKEKI